MSSPSPTLTYATEADMTAGNGFGVRLRQAREQAGLTQESLAHESGLSGWWINRIEARGQEPRLGHLLALHEALAHRLPNLSLAWLAAGARENRASGSVIDDLRRRTFVQALAGATVLPTTFLSPLILDLERARAAVALEPALLDGWARLTEIFAALRPIQPPHHLLPSIDTHLLALRSRVAERVGSDVLWRRLLSITAATSALAAWVAFMADQRTAARGYVDQADALAREADDNDALMVVLMLRADLLSAIPLGGMGGLPRQAREQLKQALTMTSSSTPLALRGPLLLRAAEEHAFAGDEMQALRHLELAEAAVAASGPRTHYLRPAWGEKGIAESVVDAFRGNCYQMLGRPSDALQILEAIAHDRLRNDRAANLTDRAAAHARLSDPERSCELLREAADLATENGRTVVIQRINGVRRQHLALWADERPVLELDERLAEIV